MRLIFFSLIFLFFLGLVSCSNFGNLNNDEFDRAYYLFEQQKYSSCLSALDDLLSESSQLNPIIRAKSLHLKGYVLYCLKHEPSLVLSTYLEALSIYKKTNSSKNTSRIYADLGNLFYDNFSFENALDYYTQANIYAKRANYDNHIISTYYDIGKSQRRLGIYEDAMENLTRSMIRSLDDGNYKLWASTKIELGNLYFDLKDYDRAMTEYGEITELFKEDQIGLEWQIAQAAKNIGMSYFEKQEYEQAEEHLNRSLAYEVLDSTDMAASILKLGQIALTNNKPLDGLALIKQSIVFNTGYQDIEELGEAGESIVGLFASQQMPDSANYYKVMLYDMFTTYTKKWKDRTFKDIKNANTLNAKHDELVNNELTRQRRNDRTAAILVFVFLVLCLSFTSIKLWQYYKRRSGKAVLQFKESSEQRIADLELEIEREIQELKSYEDRNSNFSI